MKNWKKCLIFCVFHDFKVTFIYLIPNLIYLKMMIEIQIIYNGTHF